MNKMLSPSARLFPAKSAVVSEAAPVLDCCCMFQTDQVKRLLDEYGWKYHEVLSPVDPNKTTLISTCRVEANNLRFVVTINADEHYIFATTNKLFRYPPSQKEVLVKFLELNDKTFGGKWVAYREEEIYYINYAFEIYKDFLNSEMVSFQLDALLDNVEMAVGYLTENRLLDKENLTPVETVTRQSLNLENESEGGTMKKRKL